MTEILKDPKLANNAQLWARIGELQAQYGEKIPDHELTKLLKDFRATSVTSESGAASITSGFSESPRLNISRAAMKEIDGMPPNLREKVQDFLDVATKPNGFREFYNNPGRWHMEQVRDGMTVRLNSGYRVLFRLKDGAVQVLRVNKGQIHGN